MIRPVARLGLASLLALLDPDEREQFVAELAQRVSQACPSRLIGGELVELVRVLVVECRSLSKSHAPLTVSGASKYPFPMIIGKGSIPAGSIAFRLDPTSGVPTYLQLVHQVEQALRLGVLGPGDQLPTVKEVVGGLAINPNTVQKAYRELEHRGLAAGKPGQGTFVKVALRRVGGPAQEALARRLGEWVRDAVASGLDTDSIDAMFAAALRDLGERRDGMTA